MQLSRRPGRWLAVLVLLSGCHEPRYLEKTEKQWVAELESGDVRSRAWAAGALENMDARSDRARHALVLALNDSAEVVQVAAMKALARREEGRGRRESIVIRLWQIARDSSSDAQIGALEALAREPYQDDRSIDVLMGALRHSSEAIRATAASSLRQFGPRAARAETVLHELLRDSSEIVRHEADDALKAMKREGDRH